MRFVHVADTHLGCSNQGKPEREADFREAFSEIIERTLELSPEAFVHAGDLFERSRPSNTDIFLAVKELLRLIRAGIDVLLLPGNHDKKPVRGETAPQAILELMGAKVFGFSEDKMRYVVDGVEFWGLPYMKKKDEVIRFVSEMGQRAKSPAVLVLHQYVYPPMSLLTSDPVLYHQDILSVFSYGAFGHWHIPWMGERFAYPGSTEATELSRNESEVRKRCFYLVEIGDSGVSVEPQFLTKTRPFFYLECREEDLLKTIDGLKERMASVAKKPILKIKIRGGPEMRADAAVENALAAAGLKRGDFLIFNVIPERMEPVPAERPSMKEPASADIIEKFFGGEPRLRDIVLAMRDAVAEAEAEREYSGNKAKRDREFLIEAAKLAAIKHLEDEDNASS